MIPSGWSVNEKLTFPTCVLRSDFRVVRHPTTIADWTRQISGKYKSANSVACAGKLFALRGGRQQNPIRADQLRRATDLSMFGLLDYRWPHSRVHSPRPERMTEKSAVTPSAMSAQTKKKAPLDLAILPPAGLIWFVGFLLVGFVEEYLNRGYLLFTLTRGLAGIYSWLFKTRQSKTLGFWTSALIVSLLLVSVTKPIPESLRSGYFQPGSAASSSASACGVPAHFGGLSAFTPRGTGPSPFSMVSRTADSWSNTICWARTRSARRS